MAIQKDFVESLIIDKWYNLLKASRRGENVNYLRGDFSGFCSMAEVTGIVTDEDIEQCKRAASMKLRDDGDLESTQNRGKIRKWLREVVLTDILHRACRMTVQKTPGSFQAEADDLAHNIRVFASSLFASNASEEPLHLADVIIDEVRRYY